MLLFFKWPTFTFPLKAVSVYGQKSRKCCILSSCWCLLWVFFFFFFIAGALFQFITKSSILKKNFFKWNNNHRITLLIWKIWIRLHRSVLFIQCFISELNILLWNSSQHSCQQLVDYIVVVGCALIVIIEFKMLFCSCLVIYK